MTPYAQGERWELYHGDAVESVAGIEPVSCVLTDPPFYLPAHVSSSRRNWPRSLGDLGIMDGYFRFAWPAIVARLRPNGAFYAFCDATSYAVFLTQLYPLFDRTQDIPWDKGEGGFGNGWRHSHELILHGARSGTAYADGFRRDVLSCPVVPSADRDHPSEKPVALCRELLRAHPPGRLLDHYCGSGAILEAGLAEGWTVVGVEAAEDRCAIAARRLRAAEAQPCLPMVGRPRAEQGRLL